MICRFWANLFNDGADKEDDGRNDRPDIVDPAVPVVDVEPQVSGEKVSVTEINAGEEVIKLATSFVGVHEEGGDNKGPQVEEFQKAVDGKAQGESWCLGFCMYVLIKIAATFGLEMRIHKTEGVTDCWNKSPKECRVNIEDLMPGDLLLWQYYDAQGNPTWKGHCGFFKCWSHDGRMETIEGNTGPALGEIEREGDGVYLKIRTKGGTSKMKLLGGLRAFAKAPELRLS